MDAAVHAHVVALASLATRGSAAQAVAQALGCEELALFVRDRALGLLVPAPGMPKTFAGGKLWRSFLQVCTEEGRHDADVDLPANAMRHATALSRDGAVAVLLGGAPRDAGLAILEANLPLLAALLKAEQDCALGRAEVAEAQAAAQRAHALVGALDAARASAAGLNEQLRREHSRKDEFLAMLAHELRNPLSPLVNSLGLLRMLKDLDPATVKRQLDIMGRQVDQLTRLVDDLLDVSRVSRGLIELRRERLPLAEVLDTAVEAARPAIEARRHKLQLFGERGPLHVNGDRVRLTQVFANLLQNAAKYTDPGGTISLGIVADSGRASVVVRDSGVGIPPSMLSRIFDLFEQVPVSLDRSQGGLGIGLTLVRTLAELHGGHVTAHSVGLGQGSTFTVSLPLVAAPVAGAPAPQGRALRPTDARVLVVDDNADAGDTLADMLRFMGAQARVARDGPEAITLAQSFAPDLILLDIGLPGMDGYEAARRLRELPGLQMRLVALTGYGSAQDRARSKAAGFDAHLVKPVSADYIEQMLGNLGFGEILTKP
ncbi:MAG: hybrid sensor histidine kinase/response regulator [Ramlibacter sp.]|nr:hybrid sensor histidine kinase/response regulator [Ramlibacter sp.]